MLGQSGAGVARRGGRTNPWLWRAPLAIAAAAGAWSVNLAAGFSSLRFVFPFVLLGVAVGGLGCLLEMDRHRAAGTAPLFARRALGFFFLALATGSWAAVGTTWAPGSDNAAVTQTLLHALLPLAGIGVAFACGAAGDALWTGTAYGLGLVAGFYATYPKVTLTRTLPETMLRYVVDQAWAFGGVALLLYGVRRAVRPVQAKEWPIWAAVGLSAGIMAAVWAGVG